MAARPLQVGGLFSGISGLESGLERAGMEVVWQCEQDKACQKLLSKRFLGVPCYDDVRSLDGSAPRVDVLCGGFPCQDVSVAGNRAGLAGERSGLFGEFMRIADSLSPRWILIENVPGLLSSGHVPGCSTPGCASCAPGEDMSDVLETGPVPPKYFLSPKAAQGILRRAEARGRALPPTLQRALTAVATPPGSEPNPANT